MKAFRSFAQAIPTIAFATCFSSFLPAQEVVPPSVNPTVVIPVTPPPSAPPLSPGEIDFSQGVYLASVDADNYGLRRYAGQKLYNTEGAELGSVRDFIVHPISSRVRYVVVSTGGVLGGMGNSLRLVPFEALRHGGPNLFQVEILQAHWLQIPPVNDRDYVVDRFNYTPAQHQEMLRPFLPPNSTVAVSADANDWAGLMRASVFRGKQVFGPDRKIGEIDNIILDLERGLAAALLDPRADFTGTSGKYLIPLGRLVFNDPRQNQITTTLTRADFDVARQSTFGATVATPPPTYTVVTEPPLSPTGRVASPPSTPVVSESLVHSARAIRSAIDHDPVLVAENVQVTAENGRIILRGSVRSDAVRTSLEATAQRAVSGVAIENQIAVVRP